LLGRNRLLETAFSVGSDRVRRVDDDLTFQWATIGGDQLLDRVEIDREDHDIGFADSVGNRHGFGVAAGFGRELLRLRERLVGNHDLPAAHGQVLRHSRANIAETDNCSFHWCSPFASALSVRAFSVARGDGSRRQHIAHPMIEKLDRQPLAR
jgi:hypothetical protein